MERRFYQDCPTGFGWVTLTFVWDIYKLSLSVEKPNIKMTLGKRVNL